jgi:hypothetical protein
MVFTQEELLRDRSHQTIEAIKIILGMGDLLTNKLLCFCGYDMTFREFQIVRDPHCPVCGQRSA